MNELEVRLLERLKLMVEWVKYAEAKNAALVAFTSGATAAFFAFLKPDAQTSGPIRVLFSLVILAFVSALALALASFIPNTNHHKLVSRNRAHLGVPGRKANTYYYEDLRLFTVESLVRRIAGHHDRDVTAVQWGADKLIHRRDENLLHLTEEVIANALIARKKFLFFRAAVGCALVGLLPLVILLAIGVINGRW